MHKSSVFVILFAAIFIAGIVFYVLNGSPDTLSHMPVHSRHIKQSEQAVPTQMSARQLATDSRLVDVPIRTKTPNPEQILQDNVPYGVKFARALRDAKQGVPGALYRLDNAITACEGVPKDENGYQKWLALHAADNMPNFDAMRDLMTRCKDIPTLTFRERESLYRNYADKGSAEGAYMLGALYGFGTMESEKWLERAAREGYVSAASMLAETYDTPASDGADREKAYLWYLVASQLGDKQAVASAAQIAETLETQKILDAQNQAFALVRGVKQGVVN